MNLFYDHINAMVDRAEHALGVRDRPIDLPEPDNAVECELELRAEEEYGEITPALITWLIEQDDARAKFEAWLKSQRELREDWIAYRVNTATETERDDIANDLRERGEQ